MMIDDHTTVGKPGTVTDEQIDATIHALISFWGPGIMEEPTYLPVFNTATNECSRLPISMEESMRLLAKTHPEVFRPAKFPIVLPDGTVFELPVANADEH